jgi:hypothetical protein
MTDREHELQRNLVALSLRFCPEGDRRHGKGHEARHDPQDQRH